jgi:hypothetical protein
MFFHTQQSLTNLRQWAVSRSVTAAPDRILRTESLAAVVIVEAPVIVWCSLSIIPDGTKKPPVTV